MSDWDVGITASNLPPTVPTSFPTQNGTPPVADGTAVPALNIITFGATSSSVNDIDGLLVSGSGSLVNYALTNRYQTSQTFSDNSAHTILTFPMGGTPGVYQFNFTLAAFNNTTSEGAGYTATATLRTDGAVGHSVAPFDFYEAEEGSMTGTTVTFGLQANNFFVSVQGYGGNKINWNLTGTYTFVSNI